MAFLLSSLVGRLRSKVDAYQIGRDDISQDGTSYNVQLSSSPVLSGSETIYLTHSSFTTGLNQFIYRADVSPSPVSSGLHITYMIDYERGELDFYQGSGTLINSTGLRPFAPWNTSTVIAKYKFSTYSDSVLVDHLSYAVAEVEISLQLGMYISGYRSGVLYSPPGSPRLDIDYVDKWDFEPYREGEKIVIAESVDVLQELIAMKATYDIVTRERRVGAGDAIKIVDGDTQIDTSVNQRYLAEFVRDLDKEYKDKLKFVMYNMSEGYTLTQINEQTIPGSFEYYY